MKNFLDVIVAFLVGLVCVISSVVDMFSKIFVAFFCNRLFRLFLWWMYFKSQNDYFNWNMKPQSDAELITDGIWVLLLMLALWPENKSTVTITTPHTHHTGEE